MRRSTATVGRPSPKPSIPEGLGLDRTAIHWSDEKPRGRRPKIRREGTPRRGPALLPSEAGVPRDSRSGGASRPQDAPAWRIATRVYQRAGASTPLERTAVAFTIALLAAMGALTWQGQPPKGPAVAEVETLRRSRERMAVSRPLEVRIPVAEESETPPVPWTLLPPPKAKVVPRRAPASGEDVLEGVPTTNSSLREKLRLAVSAPTPARGEAEQALVEAGPEAVPYLTAVLDAGLDHPNPDLGQLETVAAILGRISDGASSGPLRRAAESSHDDVRQMALAALWERRDPLALSLATRGLQEDGPKSHARSRGILPEAGEEAHPALVRALRDGEEASLLEVLTLLTGQPVEGALHPLVRLLDHEAVAIRQGAVRALGYWGNGPAREETEAVVAVSGALLDPAPEVRSQAALALLSLNGKETVEDLLELMQDEDEGVRRAARKSLAGLCGTDAGGSYYAWQRHLEDNHEPTRRP